VHFLFPIPFFSFFSCNDFHTDGLHLSRLLPCSSEASLPLSTFLLDVQSSTDKKFATTQDRQTLQNSDEISIVILILRNKQRYRFDLLH